MCLRPCWRVVAQARFDAAHQRHDELAVGDGKRQQRFDHALFLGAVAVLGQIGGGALQGLEGGCRGGQGVLQLALGGRVAFLDAAGQRGQGPCQEHVALRELAGQFLGGFFGVEGFEAA